MCRRFDPASAHYPPQTSLLAGFLLFTTNGHGATALAMLLNGDFTPALLIAYTR